MNVNGSKIKYKGLISSVGRVAVSALFPHDFELYMAAIELVTSNGKTIDYFAFPIMPNSIQYTEPKQTVVKKTSSGITVLSSDTFMPGELTIKGDFGRNFKIVLPRESSLEGVAFSRQSGKYHLLDINNTSSFLNNRDFNFGIKTGYGAVKILKSIISKSTGVDGFGKPFRLYFYNMALGESYLVSVSQNGLVVSQNIERNMIWEYNLTMKILSPLQYLSSQKKGTSLLVNLEYSYLQKKLNNLSSNLFNVL